MGRAVQSRDILHDHLSGVEAGVHMHRKAILCALKLAGHKNTVRVTGGGAGAEDS